MQDCTCSWARETKEGVRKGGDIVGMGGLTESFIHRD